MESNTFPVKVASGETVLIVDKKQGDNADDVILTDTEGVEYIVRSASGEPVAYPRYEEGLQPVEPKEEAEGDAETLAAAEAAAAEALKAELDADEDALASAEASQEAQTEGETPDEDADAQTEG